MRINSSSVALAVVSRLRVVTHSNPSPEYQFLDTLRAPAGLLDDDELLIRSGLAYRHTHTTTAPSTPTSTFTTRSRADESAAGRFLGPPRTQTHTAYDSGSIKRFGTGCSSMIFFAVIE